MNKTFIKTKNVVNFVSLMNELQNLPPNIPKMALVCKNLSVKNREIFYKYKYSLFSRLFNKR